MKAGFIEVQQRANTEHGASYTRCVSITSEMHVYIGILISWKTPMIITSIYLKLNPKPHKFILVGTCFMSRKYKYTWSHTGSVAGQ